MSGDGDRRPRQVGIAELLDLAEMRWFDSVSECSSTNATGPRVERAGDVNAGSAIPVGEDYPYQRAAKSVVKSMPSTRRLLLVCSPTGSGKTRVIEETIKTAKSASLRVIIGVPLVALADELSMRLERDTGIQTGIRTGPIKRKEESDVLVGTYESILYMIGEAGLSGVMAVVLDELHSLAAPDRGYVVRSLIEETAKASNVSFVGLSGTMPNDEDIGRYIAYVFNGNVTLVGMSKRPIDLVSHFFDCAVHGKQDLKPLSPVTTSGKCTRIDSVGLTGEPLMLCRTLRDGGMFPTLLVGFSCAKLDRYADRVCGAEDFSPGRYAKSRVAITFREMYDRLEDREDDALFKDLERLACRGIGVHHSRKPPQYLSLLGQLVRDGHVPVVFCTSTLSAGLNLPVRCVCILEVRVPVKDEAQDREVRSFEPISSTLLKQILGRAGRPGLEPEGHSVFVGTGASGKLQCASLLGRPEEPVEIPTELREEEVLVSLSKGQYLPFERLVVGCSAEDRRRVEEAHVRSRIGIEILNSLRGEEVAVMGAIRAAAELSRAPQDMRYAACGMHARLRGARYANGDLLTGAGTHGVPFTSAGNRSRKKPTKVPLQALEALIRYKDKARLLSDALDDGLHLSPVWNTCKRAMLFVEVDEECVKRIAPLYDIYEHEVRKLEKMGAVDSRGAITDTGKACSRFRGVLEPVKLYMSLMKEPESFFRLVVLAVAPQRHDTCPEDIVDSMEEYAKGASTFACTSKFSVDVGTFCRILVRCNDLLLQVSECFRNAGNPAKADEVKARADALKRGLAFHR